MLKAGGPRARALGGLPGFGRWPAEARGSVPRGPPQPRVPRPARGPVAATAGPAGAARGLHWACSDGRQVAARASFRAARLRDLPGRPAPPGCCRYGWWGPPRGGPGARAAAIADTRAPPHPHPGRGGHTGGPAGGLAAPGPRASSGIWGAQAQVTWRGQGGARAGAAQGWAIRTRRRWRGRELQAGGARGPAPVSPAQSRGAQPAGI